MPKTTLAKLELEPNNGINKSNLNQLLIAAIYNGDVRVVKELVKHGVNVHLPMIYDMTPIKIALINKHIETIAELIKCGAIVELPNTHDIMQLLLSQKFLPLAMTQTYKIEFNLHFFTLGFKLDLLKKSSVQNEGLCHGFALKWLEYKFSKNDLLLKELISKIMLYGDQLYDMIKNAQTKKTTTLTEEDVFALDILSFYESMMLYQKPEMIKHNRRLNQNDVETISKLTAIDIIKNAGGFKKIYSNLNICTTNQVSKSLSKFRERIQQIYKHSYLCKTNERMFGFNLRSYEHSISLLYNLNDDYWDICDINNPFWETLEGTATGKIANIMFSAFAIEEKTITPYIVYDISVIAPCNHFFDDRTIAAFKECFSINLENKEILDQINCNGLSPLYIASQEGHLEVVEALIKYSANINTPMNDGVIPLYIASEKGHSEVVEALIKYGANINAHMNDGATPLHIASQKGHYEVIKVLIKYGANVNSLTNTCASPLFIASQNGHLEIVEALIKYGANVNTPTNDGATPLHIASQKGHYEVVVQLISYNADISITNINGYTALDIAIKLSSAQIVAELEKHKAQHDKYLVWMKTMKDTKTIGCCAPLNSYINKQKITVIDDPMAKKYSQHSTPTLN